MPAPTAYEVRATLSVISPGVPATRTIDLTGSYNGISAIRFRTRKPGVKFVLQIVDEEVLPGEGPITWTDTRLVWTNEIGEEESSNTTQVTNPTYVGGFEDKSLRVYLYSDKPLSVDFYMVLVGT